MIWPFATDSISLASKSLHFLLPDTGDNDVEYILRVLQVKKIPFTSYDLASDEDAKKLWKRKTPLCECLSPLYILGRWLAHQLGRSCSAKQQLPGILVGGVYPGGYEELYVSSASRVPLSPSSPPNDPN